MESAPGIQIEVRGLKARMVAAQRAHPAGPRTLYHEVPANTKLQQQCSPACHQQGIMAAFFL